MKSNAGLSPHGILRCWVDEWVKGVNFAGGSLHHIFLKAAVAVAAYAIQHTTAFLEKRPCTTHLGMKDRRIRRSWQIVSRLNTRFPP